MCANILVERVAVSINRVLRSGTWMPNRSGFRNYTPVFAREAPLNFEAEFTCPERKSTASATRLPARNSSLSGKLITACCVYLETNRLLIKLPSTRLKFTSIPADPRSCHRTPYPRGAAVIFLACCERQRNVLKSLYPSGSAKERVCRVVRLVNDPESTERLLSIFYGKEKH